MRFTQAAGLGKSFPTPAKGRILTLSPIVNALERGIYAAWLRESLQANRFAYVGSDVQAA